MKKLITIILSTLVLLTIGIVNVSAGTENVAKIVETGNEYATLAEAIADVPTNETTTIQMIDNEAIDVAERDGITIDVDKNIILDLNGFTIAGVCSTGKGSNLLTNKGTLIIKDSTDDEADGTGDGKMTYGATPSWDYDGTITGSYASNLINNRGNLTILSGYYLNNATGSACYVVDDYSNGCNTAFTLEGGLLKNTNYCPVRFALGSSNTNIVRLNGGIIEGLYASVINYNNAKTPKCDIEYNGTVINGSSTSLYESSGSDSKVESFNDVNVTVNNGFFSGSDGEFVWMEKKLNFAKGGYYKNNIADDYIVYGYECIDTPETDPNHEEYPYMISKLEVAQNVATGETYPTLQDAIDAISTDEGGHEGIIKILDDIQYIDDDAKTNNHVNKINVGNTITIDLNGHTINLERTSQISEAVIRNEGVLTIIDSGDIKGEISVDCASESDPFGVSSTPISNYGTVVLDGAKLRSGSLKASYAIDNLKGSFIMKSGELESTYAGFRAYPQSGDVNVVIEDGVIKGSHGIFMQGASNKLDVTINDGKVLSTSKPGRDAKTAIYISPDQEAYKDNMSLKINGGMFKNGQYHENGSNDKDTLFFVSSLNDGDCNKIITITGGLFSMNQYTDCVNEDKNKHLDGLCKEGYTVIPNDDPTTVMEYPWMVGKKMGMVVPVIIPEEVKGSGEVNTEEKQVEKEVKVVDSTPEKIAVAEQIKSTSTNLLPEAEKLSKNGAVLTGEVFEKAAEKTQYSGQANERLEVSVNVYLDKQLEEIEKQETVIDSFKVDITPMYIIEATRYINEERQGTTVTVTDEPQEIDISRPVVIKMYLPTNFKSSSGAGETQDRVWVKHWLSANESKVYGGTEGFEIKKDANGRYIEFVNPDGFSKFELFLEKVNPDIKPSRKKTRTYVAPVTGD